MDMKNKLDQTYKPESVGRKKKILVGLSGGIDSLVTAYLLKIQKYELIAATVVTGWESYPGDQAALPEGCQFPVCSDQRFAGAGPRGQPTTGREGIVREA